jgi:hypothetical protein
MNDVKARKTVYKIAFRYGGSKANPLLSCAGGGRMMLNTATEIITKGRGMATIRLGFQGGGIVPEGCPTRPIDFGSGMFLFVLGKGHRPIIGGFFSHGSSRTSSQKTFVI